MSIRFGVCEYEYATLFSNPIYFLLVFRARDLLLSLFLSPLVTFLPKAIVIGFRDFAWGLTDTKIRFEMGERTSLLGGVIFRF